ncbi:FitA-like ribbon-helix-helix domain-containing protein [Azospirillum soli]|uniref:FitA-like ribbon-helix-helix domain-containing protein n=1 Tax=Azospirillum soli TaxID=1304799 RepID=UPI001AE411F0|nr:plasmid stabilization protein [Azospirillum soli]MBP2310750.1 plasmid stability protein [Azospirillum soli]
MGSITIRNLDEPLVQRLSVRAAHHGHSVEEEAHRILSAALTEQPEPAGNLADAIRRRFQPFGGVEVPDVAREPLRDPPGFE